MANVKTARVSLSAMMVTCMQLFQLSIWVGTGAKKPVNDGAFALKSIEKAPLSADNGNQVSWHEKMRRMQMASVD